MALRRIFSALPAPLRVTLPAFRGISTAAVDMSTVQLGAQAAFARKRPAASGLQVDALSSAARTASQHDAAILDQFTRQSGPFTAASSIAEGLSDLVALAAPRKDDDVLDVACGGGLVTRAFAPASRSVTGIDITPAMLKKARSLCAEAGLKNVKFVEGNASALPFPDNAFSVVVTRYSVHHMQDPGTFVRELARVCKRGGTVVIADVVVSENKAQAAAFNRLEILRDPSHVANLSHNALQELMLGAGLRVEKHQLGAIRDHVEPLLARSFPASPADADEIRRLFRDSVTSNALGIPVQWNAAQTDVAYAYPVVMLRATKP